MGSIVGNSLRVHGTKLDLEMLFLDIETHCEKEFDFNFIIPMPPHQPDLDHPNPFYRGGYNHEIYEKYGNQNSIHWAKKHWGCGGAFDGYVSSIQRNQTGHYIEISFSTSYESATGIIGDMSSKYPKLKIYYEYHEEDGFWGKLLFSNGNVIKQKYSDESIMY